MNIADMDRYGLYRELRRSRTASAAWKAECKAQKKRVAELEKWIVQELDRRAELEEALASLLDGLDSNYDERCGLTGKEWEQRIFDAGLVLKREV